MGFLVFTCFQLDGLLSFLNTHLYDGSIKDKKITVEATVSKDYEIVKMSTKGSYDTISLNLNGGPAR